MFIDKQVNARRDVGLVVSLVDPKRRIPTPSEYEWEDWDAEFKVIAPVSAEQVACVPAGLRVRLVGELFAFSC